MPSDCGIYKISNTVSGKVYVGSAVNCAKRWRGHIFHLRRGTHKNPKLQASFAKHGEVAFVFCLIETCAATDLIAREQHWIDALKVVETGYNINPTAGNSLGRKFPFRNLTEAHKQKISAGKLGRPRGEFSPEWRAKLSEVAKRKRPNQSIAASRWWSKRPKRRATLTCVDCGASREIVPSARKNYAESYRCRGCYLGSYELAA